MITLFRTEPAQSLQVLLTLATQASTADAEESKSESRFVIFAHRWKSSEDLSLESKLIKADTQQHQSRIGGKEEAGRRTTISSGLFLCQAEC